MSRNYWADKSRRPLLAFDAPADILFAASPGSPSGVTAIHPRIPASRGERTDSWPVAAPHVRVVPSDAVTTTVLRTVTRRGYTFRSRRERIFCPDRHPKRSRVV